MQLVTRTEGSLAVVALRDELATVVKAPEVSRTEQGVEARHRSGQVTELRTVVNTQSVRTYVSHPKGGPRPRMCGQVDRSGVYIHDDDVDAVITHKVTSRLERLGAALDSLNPFSTWSDPPRTFENVKDVGHLRFPDGSVVVSAVEEDGRVTTWSRGPDGWFQRRLRGLGKLLKGA